ncbi:MAG: M1 family metallopeptidase [Actinobacteria bacterium]|nr:M1 family metallopeptidase [Actinomycetota bacterium]
MPESTGHRLPRTVAPSAYRLHIDTDLSRSAFSGAVDIDLVVAQETSTVVCNAAHLEVGSLTMSRAVDGAHGPHEAVDATFRLDEDREFLIVDLATPLAAGSSAVFHIEFSGVLNDQLVGYYRSAYTVDGDEADDLRTEVLAVTQFEAPYARWAFPCWDEPEFKATFEISLTCDAGLLAVSNGAERSRVTLPDGRVRFEFAPTMPMSTYLVAWIVGELEASRTVRGGTTDIRVLHRPGHGPMTEFALDCAAHAVAWFEEYYAIDYPGDKLDLVAVPDFAFGAMENLGCVTFRETLLLIDPARANRTELERAATVIEHEIAHMWFGDLVTMQWWDGIWLNEAFATFMEISCADSYRPDWNIWTSFSLLRSAAFDTDGLGNTRSIEFDVDTPADAEAMFDILTYEKGAAVLRMFEQWATPEVFRDGVRTYLLRHAYANTETVDLWTALGEHSGIDVGAMMDTWIRQGGHPIVTASLDGTTLHLTQRRYRYAGGDVGLGEQWIVPLRIATSVGGVVSEQTVLFDGAQLSVELDAAPQWLTINAGATGFYRSHYDPTLRRALVDNIGSLATIDRYSLLDDAWALFLAGELPFAEVVGILRAVAGDETDPSVWRLIASVTGQLSSLAQPSDRPVVQRLVAEVTAGQLGDLSQRGATADDRDRRAVVLRLAGTVADSAEVIAVAREAFTRVGAADGDPDFDSAVLDVAAAHGDERTYERLVELSESASTPQEELRALNALARLRDPELIARVCERCATVVRTQNAPYTLAAAMGNPACGPQVWRFVADRWDELLERFPSSSIDRMIGGIRSFADRDLITEIAEFIEEHPRPQSGLTLAQHLERTRVNAAARERLAAELAGLAE